ncbi:hypothetical protein [uncultured Catenibacterium sp.]|uniref:hypothetical protein n=1 Tax=uncultured Catenibacterium sp. TaxID=286142 RepID=UPI0026298A28|nr:hypothetical protein [uncultured Catenibacterium sp.]
MNNPYQSLAYHEYANNYSFDPYLVLDLDHCSYGICKCGGNYCDLLYTNNMGVNLCTMYHTLLEKYAKDIYASVEQQVDSSNQAIKKAIEENNFQQVVYHFENKDITYSDLDMILTPLKYKLKDLFEDACHHIEDPQHVNIIVLGDIYCSYIIERYCKEYFTNPPFKSDQSIIPSSYLFVILGDMLLREDFGE